MRLQFSVFGTFSSLLCLLLICFICFILFMLGFVFETEPSSPFNTLYILPVSLSNIYTFNGIPTDRKRATEWRKIAKGSCSISLYNTTLHHSWTRWECVHGRQFGNSKIKNVKFNSISSEWLQMVVIYSLYFSVKAMGVNQFGLNHSAKLVIWLLEMYVVY